MISEVRTSNYDLVTKKGQLWIGCNGCKFDAPWDLAAVYA